MHVRGKKENIERLLKIMTDYEEPRHFWRVFTADADFYEPDPQGITIAHIFGDCAWSVYSCMMTGECTYANDVDTSCQTGLQDESKRLELELELYSDECGFAFQEHYHFNQGEEIANECVDCVHYYFEECCDETEDEQRKRFEDFKLEHDLDSSLTPDDLDDASEIVVGGFGEWEFKF